MYKRQVLGDEFEVVEEYLGKDLEYREYEQFLPFLSVNKKAFYITVADYVTMEDGTGIVHIAVSYTHLPAGFSGSYSRVWRVNATGVVSNRCV